MTTNSIIFVAASILALSTIATSYLRVQTPSQLVETLTWYDENGTESYTMSVWEGEFYKGEVFGIGMQYFLKNKHIPDLTEFIFLNSPTTDPALIDWANEGTPWNLQIFSSVYLQDYEYVLIKYNSTGSNPHYEQIHLNPIKFEVVVRRVLNQEALLRVKTTLKGVKVHANASVQLSIIGVDDCQFTVAASKNSVYLPMQECEIYYGIPFQFVLATGPFLSSENSEVFSLVCDLNLDNQTISTGNITNIDAPIDSVQEINDFISPTIRFVSATDNSPITEAFLGDRVRLLIDIPQEYRTNFDIKIIDCSVDGELVLQNQQPLTNYFSAAERLGKGSFSVDFSLLRKLQQGVNERLVVVTCTIDTCLDTCDTSTLRRRRRSVRINRRLKKRYKSWGFAKQKRMR